MKKHPFTLLECLAVVSVILLLVSMILAGLSVSKAKSQRVICANNFSQLNRCWAMYSQVNRNQICPFRIVNGTDNLTAWTAYLKPYYANYQIMLCPADPRTKTIKSESNLINSHNYETTTGYNAVLGNTYSSSASIKSLAKIKNTSNTPVFADSPWNRFVDWSETYDTWYWVVPRHSRNRANMKAADYCNSSAYSNPSMIVQSGYADGSVQYNSWNDFYNQSTNLTLWTPTYIIRPD
jgi:type II secretory pathway pseudopilin PulG